MLIPGNKGCIDAHSRWASDDRIQLKRRQRKASNKMPFKLGNLLSELCCNDNNSTSIQQATGLQLLVQSTLTCNSIVCFYTFFSANYKDQFTSNQIVFNWRRALLSALKGLIANITS